MATGANSSAEPPSQPQSCIIEEVVDELASSSAAPQPEGPSSTQTAVDQTQQGAQTGESASSSSPAVPSAGEDAVAAAAAGAGAEAAGEEASCSTEQAPSTQEQQQLLEECERLKQQGNAAYGRGDYDEALQLYWQAIDQAPEGVQQRAVYLCNAAACYLKKEMWQAAVEQCTLALSIDDRYLKALMRRAQALQQQDDLERALADAQRVLELDPGNSWASKTMQELQPEVQQRQEKMKEEMIGKLKDLGNNLLGKFGMSLDNFKAEQDPSTGGYSIKFVQ